MKAKAKVYRGIEFIRVSDLPTNQQLLLQYAQEPERIKILVDGEILENCIQYREYSQWYTAVYSHSVALPTIKSVQEEAFHVNVAS